MQVLNYLSQMLFVEWPKYIFRYEKMLKTPGTAIKKAVVVRDKNENCTIL